MQLPYNFKLPDFPSINIDLDIVQNGGLAFTKIRFFVDKIYFEIPIVIPYTKKDIRTVSLPRNVLLSQNFIESLTTKIRQLVADEFPGIRNDALYWSEVDEAEARRKEEEEE